MNNTYYQRPNNSGKKSYSNNTDMRQVDKQQYDEYYKPSYQVPHYETDRREIAVNRSRTKELVANIILIVLSILFVLAFLQLALELSDINRNYENSVSSFWREYDSGRYVGTIKDRYENYYNGVEVTEELAQCYAVSEYFEAASLYKAAVHTGKADKAAEYKATMEDAYLRMGDVSYLAEDINKKLGITDLVE